MSRALKLGVAMALLAAHAMAGTVLIQYTLVPLGGNLYRYVYSVTNNGSLPGGAPIRLFDIYFDTSLYQETSLQIVTPSGLQTQWSQNLFSSLPGVPAAYDVLSISGVGIPAGTSVSGFAVEFRWLGSGTPGSQPFQIYDSTTFLSLQQGQTATLATVPTLSAWSMTLLGVGLAGASAIQARRQAQAKPFSR